MKRLLFILLLVFSGCYKVWWEESEYVDAPNWASNDVILFLYTVERIKWVENRITGGRWPDVVEGVTYLYEVDTLGNYREVGEVFNEAKRFSYLSVGGGWIVISVDDGPIYVMKRDLSEVRKVGYGGQADMSPDGRKFVYVRKGQGLWIKNIDGSNDKKILDLQSVAPNWGPGGKIVFHLFNDTLYVIDTIGNFLKKYYIDRVGPGLWDQTGDTIATNKGINNEVILISLVSDSIISIDLNASIFGWSPSGSYFIAYDGDWYVIKRDGSRKFYINP